MKAHSFAPWIGAWCLLVVACSRPDGGGDGGAETGETGDETGGTGALVCDDTWEEYQRKPFYVLGSFGGDGFFVAVAFEQIVTFDGETWTTNLLEQGVFATRVWASAPDDVWFIDTYSGTDRFVHWDGAELTSIAEAEPGNSYFSDVWGSGPDDVWLAGRQACPDFDPTCEPLLRRYHGTEFTDVVGHGLQEPSAVWGRGPDEVFVGSRSGMTARFDGQAWTPEPTGDTAITHITSDGSQIFALGHPNAYRWYGEGWSVIGGTVPYPCDHVATVGGRLWCMEWGSYAYGVWDTGEWSIHDTQPRELQAMTAFDGEVWVSVAEPSFGGSANFMTAGAQGTLSPKHRIDYLDDVYAIDGDALSGVMGLSETGAGRQLALWSENGWIWRSEEAPTFEVWDMQVRESGREIWKVGRSLLPGGGDFELRLETPEGEQVWALPDGVAGTLRGLWVNGIDDVWLVDAYGAHHFDGTSWFGVASPADDPPVEIVTAGGHVYLRSWVNVYELIRGAWTPMRGAASVRDMDASGPDSLWVIEVDNQGNDSVVHWDGAEWTVHALGQYTLVALDVKGADDVYVSGYRVTPENDPIQRVLHWDGEGWDRIAAPYLPGAQLLVTEDGIMLEDHPYTYTLPCERE